MNPKYSTALCLLLLSLSRSLSVYMNSLYTICTIYCVCFIHWSKLTAFVLRIKSIVRYFQPPCICFSLGLTLELLNFCFRMCLSNVHVHSFTGRNQLTYHSVLLPFKLLLIVLYRMLFGLVVLCAQSVASTKLLFCIIFFVFVSSSSVVLFVASHLPSLSACLIASNWFMWMSIKMRFNCYFTAKWRSVLSANSCIAKPYVPATIAKCSRPIVYGQHPDGILNSSQQFIRLNCCRPHHYHRHHPDRTVHMLLFFVPVLPKPARTIATSHTILSFY